MSYTIRFSDGDIEFGTGGEQTTITGAEKAAQDLLDEVLLPYDVVRDRGNEMFLPDGSFTTIAASPNIGTSYINTSLRSAVARLQRAQATDVGTSQEEAIRRITTVVVKPQTGDPTSYAFLLGVEVDDRNIALARAISMTHTGVPDVGDLDD